MMNEKKISIIIPSFNSGKTITATLESIVSQNTGDDIECIVVDGSSTDETIHILQEFCTKYEYISFISEPDKGIYDAMNKGIAMSCGHYLFFLGSDDVLYDKNVLQNIIQHPAFGRYDFIYGDVLFKQSRIKMGGETHYLKLLKSLENIPHQAIFYARTIFARLGGYNLRFPIYADFHMNIQCFRNEQITKKYIPGTITIFNETGASDFRRHTDRLLITTHEEYVKNNEDIVALYDSVLFLEKKVATLMQSKEYRLGKKLGDYYRRLKRLTGNRYIYNM
jgi:glycosyltransferase involved in cell wall biosynthesis